MTTPLESIVIEPAGLATAAVIWLHGLGADGHDFESIVPELRLPPLMQVRFVFPHAPLRAVTLNRGQVMRAWYDIIELGSLRREDEVGIRASALALDALIQQQVNNGVPAQHIVLAGFSQGAAIALHVGLRYPYSLAGILALSGYLPRAAQLKSEMHAANKHTPIFLAHGTQDNVVPLRLGESTREVLIEAGYKPEWRTYAMPHSVCAAEILDISNFLQRAFLPTETS